MFDAIDNMVQQHMQHAQQQQQHHHHHHHHHGQVRSRITCCLSFTALRRLARLGEFLQVPLIGLNYFFPPPGCASTPCHLPGCASASCCPAPTRQPKRVASPGEVASLSWITCALRLWNAACCGGSSSGNL